MAETRGAGGIGARLVRPLVRRFLTSGRIPLPSMLMIEVSSLCNLRCFMCAKTLGYKGTPPDRLIDMDVVERLAGVLPFLEYVDLSGVWGEALIKPERYLRILERLKRHGITVRTISNGTLVTREVASAMVRHGLDIFSISVDAANPETYRRIRSGGELDDVIAGIRFLREEKLRQGRSTPRIDFLVLGMRDTIGELPDVIRLAAAHGVSRVVLQEMVDFEEVRGQSLAYGYRELGKEWFGRALGVARELGVDLSLLPSDQFEEPCEAESHKEATGERRTAVLKDCLLPWTMAVVTTTGDVIPCCTMFASMGTLKEKSFEEIWNGERYRKLREELLSATPPPFCVVCAARGWRTCDPRIEARAARELLALPLRRAFRRNPVLRRVKPFLKRCL